MPWINDSLDQRCIGNNNAVQLLLLSDDVKVQIIKDDVGRMDVEVD